MTDVSVITPVYNGEAWIARSVRSALEQAGPSLEVVVVDDGSTDATPVLLAQLAAEDARVKLLHSGGQLGPAAARNLAMDAACGTWLAFLDADDRFRPGRLARMLAAADEEGADLLADNQQVLTEDGRPDTLLWPWITHPTRVDAVEWVLRNVWAGPARFGYGYAKVLCRREMVESPRLRMRPELRMMEDFHFVLALLRRGHELLLLPEPLYEYTVRPSSSTNATPEAHLAHVLAAGDDVLRQLPPGSLRSAMQRQQAWVRVRAVRHEVLGRLKKGQFVAAAGLLCRHPRAVRYVLRSLREWLSRRSQPVAEGPAAGGRAAS